MCMQLVTQRHRSSSLPQRASCLPFLSDGVVPVLTQVATAPRHAEPPSRRQEVLEIAAAKPHTPHTDV